MNLGLRLKLDFRSRLFSRLGRFVSTQFWGKLFRRRWRRAIRQTQKIVDMVGDSR